MFLLEIKIVCMGIMQQRLEVSCDVRKNEFLPLHLMGMRGQKYTCDLLKVERQLLRSFSLGVFQSLLGGNAVCEDSVGSF